MSGQRQRASRAESQQHLWTRPRFLTNGLGGTTVTKIAEVLLRCYTRTFSEVAGVVDGHGLRDKLRLGTTVLGSRVDGATDIWHVEPDREEITARHVIVGIGGLEVPYVRVIKEARRRAICLRRYAPADPLLPVSDYQFTNANQKQSAALATSQGSA